MHDNKGEPRIPQAAITRVRSRSGEGAETEASEKSRQKEWTPRGFRVAQAYEEGEEPEREEKARVEDVNQGEWQTREVTQTGVSAQLAATGFRDAMPSRGLSEDSASRIGRSELSDAEDFADSIARALQKTTSAKAVSSREERPVSTVDAEGHGPRTEEFATPRLPQPKTSDWTPSVTGVTDESGEFPIFAVGSSSSMGTLESRGWKGASPTPEHRTAPHHHDEASSMVSMAQHAARIATGLRRLESVPGVAEVWVPTWGGTAAFRLTMIGGRLAFGVEFKGMPFLDAELMQESPELGDRLVHYFKNRRREDRSKDGASYLVMARDFTLQAWERRVLARQIARVISRTVRPQIDAVQGLPELSWKEQQAFAASPVTFSALEVFMAMGHSRDQLPKGQAVDLYQEYVNEAEDAWLFGTSDSNPVAKGRRGGLDHSQPFYDVVLDSKNLHDRTLAEADAALQSLNALRSSASQGAAFQGDGGGVDAVLARLDDAFWLACFDQDSAFLGRLHTHQFGPAVNRIRRFNAST